MPAEYTILQDKGLAYVSFSGHCTMAEVRRCTDAFAVDPLSRLAHKHLVDFGDLTSYDTDAVRIIETQAQLADVFSGDPTQWIFAYHAPQPVGREMANYGLRAWSAVPNVVIRMTTTQKDALNVLGQRETTFAELFHTT